MKLADLMDLLDEHDGQPQECARRLLDHAGEASAEELAAGFRTALALGRLDAGFGRQLLRALRGLPADAVASPVPDAGSAQETRYAEARERCEEAKQLAAKIDQLTERLQRLEDDKESMSERLQELRRRSAGKESLLEEVGLV